MSDMRTNIRTVTDYASPAEQRRPLAKVDVLEGLTPEEVEHLTLLSTAVRLGAGEAMALDEGRRTLLLLTSGRGRVHEPSAGGQDLTILMVEEGTVLGHTGFAPRRSRSLRVEVLEPSVVWVLEWEDFEDLVRRNPEVGVETIRLLSERLSSCGARLSDLIRKEVPGPGWPTSCSSLVSVRASSRPTAAAGYPPATPTGSWRAWWTQTGRPSPGPSRG